MDQFATRLAGPTERLDYAKLHQPLVTIVIPHFNYSSFLKDALLSVMAQTYENWECVVVDDVSSPDHLAAAEAIIASVGSSKIRLVRLRQNVGQIFAIYAGLERTTGEFLCILDPDDRYCPTFIEETVAAHLNDALFGPIVCTDQYLVTNGGVITSTNRTNQDLRLPCRMQGMGEVIEPQPKQLLYFPAHRRGWFATSTSSMMVFRRSVMGLMRPHRALAYKGGADSYFGRGAHILGGTLFLTKPLTYRLIHSENAYLREEIFSFRHPRGKTDNRIISVLRDTDVTEAITANGGAHLIQTVGSRTNQAWAPRFVAKWKRSIRKRLPRRA